MEKYIPILELTSQASTDIACDILEISGIAVLIEHIEQDGETAAFKILVPERYQERALALTASARNEPISSQRFRARRYSGSWLSKQGLFDAA